MEKSEPTMTIFVDGTKIVIVFGLRTMWDQTCVLRVSRRNILRMVLHFGNMADGRMGL